MPHSSRLIINELKISVRCNHSLKRGNVSTNTFSERRRDVKRSLQLNIGAYFAPPQNTIHHFYK